MFVHWFLGNQLLEGVKKSVILGQPLGWVEQKLPARPKVVLIIPLGFAAEAPQYQIVVYIVHGVRDGDILEHMVVHTKDIVRPGPHLLATI